MSAKCPKCGAVWAKQEWAKMCDCTAVQPQPALIVPDELVMETKRKATAEFEEILWQVVLHRTADANEGLARLSQPEVGQKREMTQEEMIREYMLDIEVARRAISVLQDLTEKK